MSVACIYGVPPPPPPASAPRRSWPTWIVLAVLLGLFYWWQAGPETPSSEVDYTTAYQWARDGKIKSATLRGELLEGTLTAPENKVTAFRTRIPPEDKDTVALLRDKNVKLRVENPEPPALLRLVLGLLPWVLIIGAWWWLSRRAQSMMVTGSGGPFAGFLKRGRKFEKSTQVATFEDVAGLAAAKRDLGEIVQYLKEP